MKIIERLYQYFDYKEIKPSAFEKKIGLSNGYLSIQKKRNADLGETIISKITENCQDLSPMWLFLGEGDMLKSDEKQLPNHNSNGGESNRRVVELYEENRKLYKKIMQLQEEKQELEKENKKLEKEIEDLKKDDASYQTALTA